MLAESEHKTCRQTLKKYEKTFQLTGQLLWATLRIWNAPRASLEPGSRNSEPHWAAKSIDNACKDKKGQRRRTRQRIRRTGLKSEEI